MAKVGWGKGTGNFVGNQRARLRQISAERLHSDKKRHQEIVKKHNEVGQI